MKSVWTSSDWTPGAEARLFREVYCGAAPNKGNRPHSPTPAKMASEKEFSVLIIGAGNGFLSRGSATTNLEQVSPDSFWRKA
jgi:hypothetical protein